MICRKVLLKVALRTQAFLKPSHASTLSIWTGKYNNLYVTVPFLLCFTLYLRAISKYKPQEAYIRRGDLIGGFLRYELEGLIYIWRGLFSEFYGILKRGQVIFFIFFKWKLVSSTKRLRLRFIALVSSRHNMLIVCHPQLMATLNKRNELVSSCRHRRTTFLSIVNVH